MARKKAPKKAPRIRTKKFNWFGKKVALLSVFDKTGIVEFAAGLIELGWTILASGGTAKKISEAGLPVTDIAKLVGGKAILGHRVVTLSREAHAGLLATTSLGDIDELKALNIPRISLVRVDMYPLKAEIVRDGSDLASVIEKTDIGGPTMLRSGAKGLRYVICDSADMPRVLELLQQNGQLDDIIVRELAAKAEFTVADYVLSSARYLGQGQYEGILGTRVRTLKYGENPRRKKSVLFKDESGASDPLACDHFPFIEGTDPSYVNQTDLDRIVETASRVGAGMEKNFGSVPYMAFAVKHGNLCGGAVGSNRYLVTQRMLAGYPEATHGSVVLLNFGVDDRTAHELRTHLVPEGQKRMIDCIIAPDFSEDVIDLLARRQGKCRLFQNPALGNDGLGLDSINTSRGFRKVRGGFIDSDPDTFVLKLKDEWLSVITPEQRKDVVLTWGMSSTQNSNTITLVKDGMYIGQGINQPSREMAAQVAILHTKKNNHSPRNSTGGSDSFFPFPDGVEVLGNAGVSVVLATSGSINDLKVIEAAQNLGVKLLLLPDAEARGFYGH